MKKILLFSLMMLGITGSAQLTIVKDVSATGLRPTDNEHFIWQNNRWNGKHYYGVVAAPSVAIAVTDGTDTATMKRRESYADLEPKPGKRDFQQK